MKNLTLATGKLLAKKSSRRHFFRFLGSASLGAGLALTGTDISIAQQLLCAGCGGGPCNPCASPHPRCGSVGIPCTNCNNGGGCPIGCVTTGEWYCCTTIGDCIRRCSECNCRKPEDTRVCCHCFIRLGVRCGPNTATDADLACACGEE